MSFSLSELQNTVLPPHAFLDLACENKELIRWEDIEKCLLLSTPSPGQKVEWFACPFPLEKWTWQETLKTLASPECHLQTLIFYDLHKHSRIISSSDVKLVADYLRGSPDQLHRLQNLLLLFIDVECEEDGRYLVEALQSPHCHLRSLSCSGSPNLARALLRLNGLANCSLSFLELSAFTSISEENSFAIFLKELPRSNLTTLRLRAVKWKSDLCFPLLAEALEDYNCGLQELYLVNMGIGDKEVEMLTKALQTTNSKCKLKVLDLSENRIRENSTRYLRDLLMHPNCELKVLFLDGDDYITTPPSYIAEALESEGCKLSCLSLDQNKFTDKQLQQLVKALCNPNCKLHNFRLKRSSFTERGIQLFAEVLSTKHSQLLLLDISKSSHPSAGEKYLVAALEKNFKLATLLFDFKDDNLKARCSVLLERNWSLARGGLQQKKWVRPQRARMFICGHPRVGKTTLRKGLQKVSTRWNIMDKVASTALSSWSCTREEASTRGIEVEALSFGKNKLVLYDLAGQREYHTFHHFFVGGNNKDMFVIVCKYDGKEQRNQGDIEDKLRYWLRFIVSHISSIKPHVIVVFNFFNCSHSNSQMVDIAKSSTRNLLEDQGFGTVLDFGEGNRNVIGIDARRASHLSQISTKLEPMLITLLDGNTIPEICNELSSILVQGPAKLMGIFRRSSKTEPFLLSYSEIVKRHSEGLRGEENDETFEAALKELHNSGQIVYFCTQVEREKQIVITDCGWFCHELVGALLEPDCLKRPKNSVHGQRPWSWKQEDLKNILRNAGQCDEHLDVLLVYLEKLELLYHIDPDEFLVPALLGEEEELRWPQVSSEPAYVYKCIGRRLECSDKDLTLLPSGIFSRLQVRIHNRSPEDKSYKVGYGWISFSDDMVNVILRYGEQQVEERSSADEKWEDKRWIDIMVRHPVGPRDAKACKILERMKNEVFQICAEDRGCRGVSLVESVLREKCVEKLGVVHDNFVSLSTIWDKVYEHGLDYSYSWSDQGGSILYELLTKSEIQGHVDKQALALSRIAQEFCVPDELGCVEEQSLRKLKSFGGIERPSEEFRSLWELLLLMNTIGEKTHKITMLAIDNVRKDISNVISHLKLAQENILLNCSNHLVIDLLEGQWPKFPYLYDKNRRWQKLSNVVGKSLRLHLMSESPRHEVKEQKGVNVTILLEWLVSITPILLPALQVLCCSAQMISNVCLPFTPPFLNTPQCLSDIGLDSKSLQQSSLPQAIKAFAGGSVEIEKKMKATKVVEKGEWGILGKLLEGKNIDMVKDFGLFKVKIEKKVMWLCEEHKKQGKVLEPTGIPLARIRNSRVFLRMLVAFRTIIV